MSKSGTGPIVTYSQDDLYDFIEGATFLATGGGRAKGCGPGFS